MSYEDTQCVVLPVPNTEQRWHAKCCTAKCKWSGPERTSKGAAKRDAVRHYDDERSA